MKREISGSEKSKAAYRSIGVGNGNIGSEMANLKISRRRKWRGVKEKKKNKSKSKAYGAAESGNGGVIYNK
jgi:hypothetical protein